MMADALSRCLQCGLFLPELTDMETGPSLCPHCSAYYQIATFPALARDHAESAAGEQILVEGESSCLFHPAKRATVVCDGCGAFLCALCDIEFDGRHLCPKCLTRGDAAPVPSRQEATRYDSVALHLALWPLLLALMCFPYLLIASAPMSLFLVFRYWNASRQPDGSPSPSMIAAAVLAGSELLLVTGLTVLVALGLFALATS